MPLRQKSKDSGDKMKQYDVIIIGKGPAGISAALYTVRANLNTLVVGADSSALLKTSKIENYYGFELPISGRQLLEAGEKQAVRIGAEIKSAEATAIEFGETYLVKTTTGEYAAKAVLIATGQAPPAGRNFRVLKNLREKASATAPPAMDSFIVTRASESLATGITQCRKRWSLSRLRKISLFLRMVITPILPENICSLPKIIN